MHQVGAEGGKCEHPEFESSAHKLRYILEILEMVHTLGAQPLKSCTRH